MKCPTCGAVLEEVDGDDTLMFCSDCDETYPIEDILTEDEDISEKDWFGDDLEEDDDFNEDDDLRERID